MSVTKFFPEGWDYKKDEITKENINNVIEENRIFQGIVDSCDEQCNLHIPFENGLNGIIPREEIEGININENGIPKRNYVQEKYINMCNSRLNLLKIIM